ncbi:hypothetical protein ACJJTC_016150 [Scirpophaga incertulas]
MSIGKLAGFNVRSGNWTLFVELAQMYFTVNKVDKELWLPTLISAMGDEPDITEFFGLRRLIPPSVLLSFISARTSYVGTVHHEDLGVHVWSVVQFRCYLGGKVKYALR